MRAALLAVRQGNDERAEEVLAVEVDSDEEEGEEESEMSEDESDGGALVCVLCGRSRSGQMFTMVAGGRWAGLAPAARVVCSDCRTEALGPVE